MFKKQVKNLTVYIDNTTGKSGLQHLDLANLANIARETLSRWLSGRVTVDFSHVEIINKIHPKVISLEGCLEILQYRIQDSRYAANAIETIEEYLGLTSLATRESDFLIAFKDGIEFYTHKQTGKSGMSIRGLARACDVDEKSIRRWLEGAEQNSAKNAETFDIIWLEGAEQNSAKVISDVTCSKALSYYAYESKAKNETAKRNFHIMAAVGMRTFIQGATGWSNNLVKPMGKLKANQEKTWQQWAETFFLGSKAQVKLQSSGRIIDLLWEDYVIEIKNISSWFNSVGQVQLYRHEYAQELDVDVTEVKTGIVLFGEVPKGDDLEKILDLCKQMGIDKVMYLPVPDFYLN